MAEKNLTGSAWKAFAKGKGYKDATLLKAFEALEKAEKGPPATQLAALDEVDRQAELLRKLHKADKDLLAWLAGVDKSLALARKAVPVVARGPLPGLANQELEQHPVLVHRHALFRVVVGDAHRRLYPPASLGRLHWRSSAAISSTRSGLSSISATMLCAPPLRAKTRFDSLDLSALTWDQRPNRSLSWKT